MYIDVIKPKTRMKKSSLDVLIVEDSLSYAIELELLCNSLGLTVIGHAKDSATALDIMFADDPDIVLMDINIGGKLSGLDIGEKTKHLECSILYITADNNKNTINRAHNSNIVDYLIKPVSEEKLKAVLAKVMHHKHQINSEGDATISAEKTTKALFFLKHDVYHKIDVKEVIFVQSDDNYCQFYFDNGSTYLLRITLKEVENKLLAHGFLRCHRRYIVNKRKINSIDVKNHNLVLPSDHNVPFSRSMKKEVIAIGELLN